MVSPGELSPTPAQSPYAKEVEARNNRIAEKIGEEKAISFIEQLEELSARYPGIINYTLLPRAVAVERRRIQGEVIGQREDGLMNDSASKESGIFVTGQLDYRAIDEIKIELELYKVEHALETLGSGAVEVSYGLHLPQGAFKNMVKSEFIQIPDKYLEDQYYLQVFSAVKFSEDGSDFQALAGGDAHLLTGGYLRGGHTNVYGTIGRIEGAGGVLWQNPSTYPDGSPRVLGNYSAGDVLEQGS